MKFIFFKRIDSVKWLNKLSKSKAVRGSGRLERGLLRKREPFLWIGALTGDEQKADLLNDLEWR